MNRLSNHVLLGFAVLLMTALAEPAMAERYLTISEAQNLCFPQADRFEPKTIRFNAEQRKAIEKSAGLKVRNLGNKAWFAYEGSVLAGVMFLDHAFGKHEYIDYVVAVSPDGKVLHIEIVEYRESHGREIRGVKWRQQFHGKTASSPLRLNADIYNISGATISCRSITEGVRRLLATFEVAVRPLLGSAAAGVPDTASK